VNRRRRALLLAGLALLLGGLAASDVASRERALRDRLGPTVGVVVAQSDIAAGARLTRAQLAVRAVPERYAPRGAVADPAALVGLRVNADVSAGQELLPGLVGTGATESAAAGPQLRAGERVAEVVAAAPAGQLVAGARVDVLVTRDDRPGATGRTVLALEDVEVLAAEGAAPAEADGAARVSASLRVTLRQAVYLAAAQAFARELRLLPRAAGDRERGRAGMSADALLGGP
jgi:pilus assembly protein CpaB